MSPAGLCFTDVTFLMSPLSFDNGWTDRNADCCLDTVDQKVTTVKNLVNFGQGMLPWQLILWRETAKIDTLRLHFVRWHSTTVWKIAKPIPIRRPPINPLHLVKSLWSLVQ